MSETTPAPTPAIDPGDADGGLELTISKVLRTGVVLSLVLLVVGLIVGFVDGSLSGDRETLDHLIDPELGASHTLDVAWTSLRSGGAVGIMTAGLCVLLATPLVRVIASIVGYVKARDWIYVALTSAVVGLLVLSMVIGAAG